MSKKKYNKTINVDGKIASDGVVENEETSTVSEENTEETVQENIETETEEVNKGEEFIVHPKTEEQGIASESDDNSNIAVENEETHETVEEEVATANVEESKEVEDTNSDNSNEQPEVVLAQIQPLPDEIYIKILTDSKKEELIKTRLFNAGFAYSQISDGTIVVGPYKTREDAIVAKKDIAKCGLRCTIR